MGRITTKEVIRTLKKIKKEANKDITIEKMYLFGSRSRGDELLTSDVDVIVVSSDFEGVHFRKRPNLFLDKWFSPVDLEILCYSPDELGRKKKEIGLVQEALKTAKII